MCVSKFNIFSSGSENPISEFCVNPLFSVANTQYKGVCWGIGMGYVQHKHILSQIPLHVYVVFNLAVG